MECRDAQFYLRLKRHAADELGPDVTAALRDHLAVCPACAADARAAASFDRAMASAMKAVPVPTDLHERLLAHVAMKQNTAFRGRLYRGATAVAAAVVLVFLGLGLISSQRPTIDTNGLVERGDEQLSDPEGSTKRWLASQKLPNLPPDLDFDYNLHVFHGSENVQGNDVPVIMFRSRNDPTGFAKVYIFRKDGPFNLKGIQDAQASLTQAEVRSGNGVQYVIVHTGGPFEKLQPFLRVRPTGPSARLGHFRASPLERV